MIEQTQIMNYKIKNFLEGFAGWLGVFTVIAGLSLIGFYVKNPF
jgi:hypothetical protein